MSLLARNVSADRTSGARERGIVGRREELRGPLVEGGVGDPSFGRSALRECRELLHVVVDRFNAGGRVYDVRSVSEPERAQSVELVVEEPVAVKSLEPHRERKFGHDE